MILISSHARFSEDEQLVNGTSSQLISYLRKNKIAYLSVYHSLFRGFPTLLEQGAKKKVVGFSSLPFYVKVVQDIFISVFFTILQKKKITLYIGINPVNAFVGCCLKKIGIIPKVVYFTADFSFSRFENNLLNKFYLFLDNFSVRNADAVWNVSFRIQNEREKKYGKIDKFFYLPNSIPFPGMSKKETHNKYALVLVSHLTKSIHFDLLINAFKTLRRKYPKLMLHIVGDGYEKRRIEQMVKKYSLERNVIFHGHVSYESVISLLKKSGIGLGIYTADNPWTKYGDSMKVREYVAYGLPVIVTNVPSTVEDVKIYNAGIVIRQREDDFKNAIGKILKHYVTYRNNALRMARANDYPKLLQTAFSRI